MIDTDTTSVEIIEIIELRGNIDAFNLDLISLSEIRQAIEEISTFIAVEPESRDNLADDEIGKQWGATFGLHTILSQLVELLVAARMAQTEARPAAVVVEDPANEHYFA